MSEKFEVKRVKSRFLRGIFEQNTYIVCNTKEAVIIDAGAEVEDLKEIIASRKVLGVLITHLHFDHIWNIEQILKEFDCKVYIQKGEEERFNNPSLNASYLIRKNMIFEVPKDKIEYYEKSLNLGSFEFKVYSTSGHSKDGVCLKLDNILFTGDTVFKDSIGRTDLPDSSNSEMVESLNFIKTLDFDIIYPGHYETSTKDEVCYMIDMLL